MPNHCIRSKPLDVALLGASGIVGQAFSYFLASHPFFRPALLMASCKRNGQRYRDSVHWLLPLDMPPAIGEMPLDNLDIERLQASGIRIVFSALPAAVAREIEPRLAQAGLYVFSNASAMRYRSDVPILVPDVNPEHLHWIRKQGFPDKGFIVTNANCSTTGLVSALSACRPFGIREIFVSTYQSVSGAGFPGLSQLQISGNAIPFIAGEEEKMSAETRKILDLDVMVQANCVRIDTAWGHLQTVTVRLDDMPDPETLERLWQEKPAQLAVIPSLPRQPVQYCSRPDEPQPNMSWRGTPPGMTVYTGRLRVRGKHLSFVLLCNNIAKGAAGGSLANAEAFVAAYGDRL